MAHQTSRVGSADRRGHAACLATGPTLRDIRLVTLIRLGSQLFPSHKEDGGHNLVPMGDGTWRCDSIEKWVVCGRSYGCALPCWGLRGDFCRVGRSRAGPSTKRPFGARRTVADDRKGAIPTRPIPIVRTKSLAGSLGPVSEAHEIRSPRDTTIDPR